MNHRSSLAGIVKAFIVLVYLAFCPAHAWAVACDLIFSNGLQATAANGTVALSFHSVITGGGATIKTKNLTDNSSWVACSGSSCTASGTASTTSTPTFVTGTGSNGAISVAASGSLTKGSGDYTTVTVGQQATLKFSSANGTYKTTAFTTNFQSVVQLESGDYWINGNLTLGQETVLKRIATSGTTRIFVKGNVNLGYKVTTSSFTSDQLLIYATGTFTGDNEANLSAFIYAGGLVQLDYLTVINGGVAGSSVTAIGNQVTVNYQSSALTTANFAPFCSGVTSTPVLLGSWHMDEVSWNGTTGEVIDSSGNGNHGKAAVALAGNTKPSTVTGTAAYTSGAQSTCRYGAFDGTGSPARLYDYVELSGFPTLPNGFTFAAWIRSSNASAQHQRILVRDDAQNGWGLSLADGTGNPELRFFNRNVTNNGAVTGGTNPNCGVFCVDTTASLASNTWYYVAAVVDTTAKTVTLYVYSQAGVQQAKAVAAYSGTWVDGTGTVAIGGETVNSSEGVQSSWHFLGNIDEVNIYSGALSQTNVESLLTTVRSCPAPDHYELEMSATNLACMGADVTVRACVDSVSPCTNIDYSINSNVTLATNAGTLSATTMALTSGDNTTKLKYPAAADGSLATVTLSGEATAANNARKCCVNGLCSVSNSCTTTFNTAGFVFAANSSGASSSIGNQTAGVSGTAYLRALKTNATTGACTARFTTPQTVPMAYKCVNPNTCITTTETLTLNGTSVQANANAASPILYSNVPLTFDVNGSAPIPINFSDVGQIQLFAQLTLAATTNDPAYTLTGSSNTFVVKPYDLIITSVKNSSGIANPATLKTGTGFTAAGAAFNVSVESYAYTTGSQLPHITPSYGREITPAETVGLLVGSLVNPTPTASTSNGALANPNAFTLSLSTKGHFDNSTVSWSEVGTFALKAHVGDGDYLGAGDVTSTTAVNVGRFYPDHFRLITANPLSATNGCAGTTPFTYLDQDNISLNYSFQAESLANTVVTNYGAGYSTSLATPDYSVENNDNGTDLNVSDTRFTAPIANPVPWTSGSLVYANSAAKFARSLSGTKVVPDGPFDSALIGVNLVDALDGRTIRSADLNTNATTTGACSGPSCSAVALGTLRFRFGRLRLDDAFGPETVKLPVNFVTEYWGGNGFIFNGVDSCTLVPRSAITYSWGTSSGGLLTTDTNRTVALTSGTTTGTYTSIDPASSGGVHFLAGSAGQYFTAPSAGGSGSWVIKTDLSTLSWLRYDWNQDGDYSDLKLPDANFTFGSYRGNDRVIYWREKLQ